MIEKVIALCIRFHWQLYVFYYYLSFVLVVIFLIQSIDQNKNIDYHFKSPALGKNKNGE